MLDIPSDDAAEQTYDHVPLSDIVEPRRFEQNVVSAEIQAIIILERGPIAEWELARQVMDRGFSVSIAYRAVRMAIADEVIVRDNRTKHCSLAQHAPRGITAKFLAWLVSVFG